MLRMGDSFNAFETWPLYSRNIKKIADHSKQNQTIIFMSEHIDNLFEWMYCMNNKRNVENVY